MEIYEPKGRAREYSPLALNYYKGCNHGCKYCYVPKMICRFNPEYCHDNVTVDVDFDRIERSAKKFAGCGKQILLSFTGDPYCGYLPETTSEVLRILNKYEHHVAILTKGGMRCINDIDIFHSFGKRIKVGASLVFDNDTDSLLWEPGAATPKDRIESLRILQSNGIKTWVSFEPVIDPIQTLALLQRVSYMTDHVKIGKINNYKGLDRSIDWSKFITEAVSICRKNNIKFYVKNDLRRYSKGIYYLPSEVDQDSYNV